MLKSTDPSSKDAFQFVQNPEPTAEQIAIQEKQAALLLEQQAESARKSQQTLAINFYLF